jgi:hypothetical protein
VGIIAVAAIPCELRSVHAMASEASAKSVIAACISRQRQCRQKCQAKDDRDNSGLRRAYEFEQFLSLDHLNTIAPLRAESRPTPSHE